MDHKRSIARGQKVWETTGWGESEGNHAHPIILLTPSNPVTKGEKVKGFKHNFSILKLARIQTIFKYSWLKYRIVASSSPSRIEAHASLFRLIMKGIFDPYVL